MTPTAELHLDLPFQATLDNDPLGGFDLNANGAFRVQLDDTNLFAQPPPEVAVELSGSINAIGQQLDGTFSFRKTTEGSEATPVTIIGATGVNATLQAGNNRILELANGEGAFKLNSNGLAGEFSVDLVDGPEIPGFAISGDVMFQINETGQDISIIDVYRDGQIVGHNVDIQGGDAIRVDVANGQFSFRDFLHLTGDFGFRRSADREITLSDGSSVVANFTSMGARNIHVFAGINGPYFTDLNGNNQIDGVDANGNGVIDASESDELSDEATGLFVENGSVGATWGGQVADGTSVPDSSLDFFALEAWAGLCSGGRHAGRTSARNHRPARPNQHVPTNR